MMKQNEQQVRMLEKEISYSISYILIKTKKVHFMDTKFQEY